MVKIVINNFGIIFKNEMDIKEFLNLTHKIFNELKKNKHYKLSYLKYYSNTFIITRYKNFNSVSFSLTKLYNLLKDITQNEVKMYYNNDIINV